MLRLIAALILAFASGAALAYDTEAAESLEKFFATFDETKVPQALHMITAEQLAEDIKKGESLVIVDVRTKGEQNVIGLTYPHTLSLPMNEVFKPSNLEQIPKDKKVVVVCKKGLRCTIISLALRYVGFDNVSSLKGGLMELMKYLGPKTTF